MRPPRLEITEISDRVLRAGGPALLFERPAGHQMPVLANLFGTVQRVAEWLLGAAPPRVDGPTAPAEASRPAREEVVDGARR